MTPLRILGMVGARAGSQRCEGKNTRSLPDGSCLVDRALTRAAAVFDRVVFSSDLDRGVFRNGLDGKNHIEVVQRPPDLASSTSRDADWVAHALTEVDGWGYDAVAIVRPTSPFLSVEKVREGAELFWDGAHPVRAMKYVDMSPWKMWGDRGNRTVKAAYDMEDDYHRGDADCQWDGPTDPDTSWLVQTGGLDIVPIEHIKHRCLVGRSYPIPLVVEGIESLDVNTEDDWQKAECLIRREMAAAARAADPGIGGTGWAMGG